MVTLSFSHLILRILSPDFSGLTRLLSMVTLSFSLLTLSFPHLSLRIGG
jgi:hypothetical protein